MTILFYPDKPKNFILWENKVRKYCRILGIKKTNNPSKEHDATMFWSYNRGVWKRNDTYYDLFIKNLGINHGCYDSTKMHNEKCMMSAFGYNTLVDKDYDGVVLRKSNLQCAHDMKEVDRVGENTDKYIYVKQINNRVYAGTVLDYRIFVFGHDIPLVVTKLKMLNKRYSGARDAELKVHGNARDLFSEDEIRRIYDYCDAYGCSITELDAIRDKDGRLYIVDNNNIAGLSKTFNRLLEEEGLWPMLADKFYSEVKRYAIQK
jgi:hypothetical protein